MLRVGFNFEVTQTFLVEKGDNAKYEWKISEVLTSICLLVKFIVESETKSRFVVTVVNNLNIMRVVSHMD